MNWAPTNHPIVRHVVNRLAVTADDQEVEQAVRKSIRRARRYSPEADQMVQEGLKHHRYNREVFLAVVGGK